MSKQVYIPKIIGHSRGMGAIQQSELQIGMYLNNDGPGDIPIYDNEQGTGTPILTISPGQEIGQIIDFSNGPNGYLIAFTSDAISSAIPLSEKVAQFFVGWTGLIVPAGSVNFSDLQNNVDESQVQTQVAAIQQAAASGTSFVNDVKKVAAGAGAAIEGAAGKLWPIGLGLAFLYLVTHAKFKSKNFSFSS